MVISPFLRMGMTALAVLSMLAACAPQTNIEKELKDIAGSVDENLSELMLTTADPQEAVNYFRRNTQKYPERVDLKRNLALSLNRANLKNDAVITWKEVIKMPGATNADKVELAGAHIRLNQWKEAKETLDSVPPTHETYDRYRLEALVADSRKDWARADSFYETAIGLTTTPAKIYNNWGYSNLNRKKYKRAEQLFGDALRYDPNLKIAKTNMVLARAKQRNYSLPLVKMTQVERAEMLYTLGLSAVKQGDVNIGKKLFLESISTHPQYFQEAEVALATLEQRNR